MLALQPIDTVPHSFRPDPVTQEEAAAMFRAVLNLFGKWELTDEQAATLRPFDKRCGRLHEVVHSTNYSFARE